MNKPKDGASAPKVSLPPPQPIAATITGIKRLKASKWLNSPNPPLKKVLLWSGLGALVLIIGLFIAGWLWYQSQLSPLGQNKNEFIKVTIVENSTPGQISQLLQDKKVIRSSQAFSIYARFSGTQNNLQAGTYRLSPSETIPQIVTHLTNGSVDTFNITFLPGATLAQNHKVLTDAGYSSAEVDAAFAAQYDSPIFATKPASADLEGYIYADTYKFGDGASVESILNYTFQNFQSVIEDNGLVAKFQAHGLTLYQGITLASIVERESSGSDAAQIAQVFYTRMAAGMALGSDVTYQYIADKTGVPRDPNLDSPYNTRRYTGLPPGPISAPGKNALLAVANPAPGDYLFFLSGDDNVTYFAHTEAEHEANITNHCKVKCAGL